MALHDRIRKLTYDDYVLIPEDGQRHEILSESTRNRDEGIKLDLYERSGVQEYWIFDPVLKKARIYRRKGDRLQIVADLSSEAGDVLSTPFLPGFVLKITEIFA